MLSEAKHLCDRKPRPFATLRVTCCKAIYVNLNKYIPAEKWQANYAAMENTRQKIDPG
jgi:hypothetical protein